MLRGLTINNVNVTWEAVLHGAKETGDYGQFPYLLLKAIQEHTSQEHDLISVTALAGCLRNAFLRRRMDYYEAPGKYLTMMMGTFMHHLIEKQETDGLLCEVKVQWTTSDGVTVTGHIDQVDPKRSSIVEWKSSRRIDPTNLPYGNHEAQVNCYRFLLANNELEPQQTVDCLWVVYLDLTGVGKTHNGVVTCPINIWSLHRTQEFIEARAHILNEAFTKDVIPDFPPRADQWLCRYCSVVEACNAA